MQIMGYKPSSGSCIDQTLERAEWNRVTYILSSSLTLVFCHVIISVGTDEAIDLIQVLDRGYFSTSQPRKRSHIISYHAP